jgi:flagella basal body P-ring formation protein FlgA
VKRAVFAALWLAAAPALGDGLIAVQERATVTRPIVRLGDVARIDGFSEAQAAELAGIELARAPRPGSERSLSGEVLRRRIERSAQGVRVEVPARVWIESDRQRVEPERVRERLEQALEARMPWPREAVRLRDWRLPEAFDVSPHATRLAVRFRTDEDFSGPVSAEFEWSDPEQADAPAVRRAAGVTVSVSLPVVVLAHEVRRGAALGESELRLERRELSRVPRGALRELSDALGQRPARDLAEGQVLVREALALDPVVQRGDTIVVESSSGGLEVRVLARALERGAPGQRIRLENPTTRQRLEAEVTGPGEARLVLPGVGAGVR